MTAAIIGLGLIGGSMAKAIRMNTDIKVYGCDIDKNTVMRAKVIEAINSELTTENIGECDYIISALYPKDTIEVLKKYAPYINKNAYVIDCGGTKEYVCREAKKIADEYGFRFIGGHPMAGIEKIGFAYSKADLFTNASMILTPHKDIDIKDLASIKEFFINIGFGKITIKTPEEHDRIIAYTSQLAHVLSSSYVKSPTAEEHRGLSAGSFRDMTRVAYLNESMWTELFFENKNNLINEISSLVESLKEYKKALEDDNQELMHKLLADGRIIKEKLDKE